MYSALNIAMYVIGKCTRDNCPISNLQLQKILYYIQRKLLQNGMYGFADEIEAWQFGPVVPVVYYMFCGFGGNKIDINYSVTIEPIYQEIVDSVVEEKRIMQPWQLVMETHQEGMAWSIIYDNGKGAHCVIPKELIRERG